MAITPEQARQYNDNERALINQNEAYIDSVLRRYDGVRVIVYPDNVPYPDKRIFDVTLDKYLAAGWDITIVDDRDGVFYEFKEKSCTGKES